MNSREYARIRTEAENERDKLLDEEYHEALDDIYSALDLVSKISEKHFHATVLMKSAFFQEYLD